MNVYYVYVERNVKLAVYDLNPSGSKAVFLIHGWPVNHEMFDYQLNILPKFGFRCIALDLRGFGNSDKPWGGYGYDRLADDVYAVIRTLNIPRMALLGFSMGGPIAIRYMTRHNAYKISKLVLVSAAAPTFTRRKDFPFGMSVEEVNEVIVQIYRNRPQAVEDFGHTFFASPITESFFRWFQFLNYSATGHSTIATLESLRDSDVQGDLAHIRVPTGIFQGALDRICPMELALAVNRGIRNSQLFRFEKSGHGVFYDEMEKFNKTLIDYLNS